VPGSYCGSSGWPGNSPHTLLPATLALDMRRTRAGSYLKASVSKTICSRRPRGPWRRRAWAHEPGEKCPVSFRAPGRLLGPPLCACFIVPGHDGRTLAYVYFDDEKGRRTAAKLLTRDQARRAKLASMLQTEISSGATKLLEGLISGVQSPSGLRQASFLRQRHLAGDPMGGAGDPLGGSSPTSLSAEQPEGHAAEEMIVPIAIFNG
jgi:hypothetical protein